MLFVRQLENEIGSRRQQVNGCALQHDECLPVLCLRIDGTKGVRPETKDVGTAELLGPSPEHGRLRNERRAVRKGAWPEHGRSLGPFQIGEQRTHELPTPRIGIAGQIMPQLGIRDDDPRCRRSHFGEPVPRCGKRKPADRWRNCRLLPRGLARLPGRWCLR